MSDEEFSKALVALAPNKRCVSRAFTSQHPLWSEIIRLRNDLKTPWVTILEFARKRGYRLTVEQIKYGFKREDIEYARSVTPWLNTSLLDIKDERFPAIETMIATLMKDAALIQDVEDEREQNRTLYNNSEATVEVRAQLLAAIQGNTRELFRMTGEYMRRIVAFREAIGDALPDDIAKGLLGEEGGIATEVTAKALAMSDTKIFYREARRLHGFMRRQMEIMVEAAKRGENIPDFVPLGPDFFEGEATEVEESRGREHPDHSEEEETG